MPLQDTFDKAYVINLAERTDRKKEILQELAQYGLMKDEGKVEIFSAIKPSDKGTFPSLGARGCFESHLSILKKAHSSKCKSVLIIEDDLLINSDLPELEAQLVREISEKKWDILYLGHWLKHTAKDDSILQVHTEGVQCSHLLMIHGRILPKLIEFLELLMSRPGGHPLGGPMHVDGAYSTFREQNKELITLLAVPAIGLQRASRSDVSENRWLENQIVFKSIFRIARKYKNLLKKRA